MAHRLTFTSTRLICSLPPFRWPLTIAAFDHCSVPRSRISSATAPPLRKGQPPSFQGSRFVGRGLSTVAMSAAAAPTVGNKELLWEPEKVAAVKPAIAAPQDWSGDLLVLAVPEEAFDATGDSPSIKDAELKALDEALGGIVTEFVQIHEFAGKAGSSEVARVGGKARCVAVVGLGPAAKAQPVAAWGASPFQAAGAEIAAKAKALRAKTAAVAFVGLPDLSHADKAAAAGKVAAGLLTGAYEATRFKAKPTLSRLESLEVLTAGDAGAAEAAIATAAGLAVGTTLTRYLVETPANICTPQYLAETAGRIAALAPERFHLDVHERAAVEKLGMGLYLGVAEATADAGNDLRLIHLTYRPEGEVKRRIGIVGKGVTFDCGGLNIKAGAGSMIEMMKFDMGGSGATLGAARVLAALQPPGVEVHFIVAACENMIDARATRPGDVLTAANGKTVEVNNTDAEGRLTLADGLWFAQEHAKVEAVVDIATLTGAMMVALGQGIAGSFTPSDALAQKLNTASSHVGEKIWRLPIEQSYWDIMKSPIADMKNAGSKYAGSITAALFLQQYVDTEKVQWAHIDIAGTAWDDKLGGATGYGAALLAQWAVLEGQS